MRIIEIFAVVHMCIDRRRRCRATKSYVFLFKEKKRIHTTTFSATKMLFHNIIINFEIRLSLYNIFLKHLPRMVEKAFVLINTNDQMD